MPDNPIYIGSVPSSTDNPQYMGSFSGAGDGGGGGETTTANGLISGGEVTWTGGLSFLVSTATYSINGTEYTSPQASITLNAADADDDRIDIIAVNSSSVAVKITGTPSATPAAPDVDPETQIALTFVYIPEDATEPTGVTSTNLYLENTEWTSSTNAAARITLASLNNPFAGTKDIEATNAVANDSITLTKPAAGTEIVSNYNNLVLNLRFKAAWANAKSLSVAWLSGASVVGGIVTVKSGVFNLDQTNVTSYQQVVIPTSTFNVPATATALRITVVGGGAAIGFYLDNIFLQAGVTSVTLPSHIMLFQGTWLTGTAYKQDDVVVKSGALYIASAPSVGSTPPSANWTLLSANGQFLIGQVFDF